MPNPCTTCQQEAGWEARYCPACGARLVVQAPGPLAAAAMPAPGLLLTARLEDAQPAGPSGRAASSAGVVATLARGRGVLALVILRPRGGSLDLAVASLAAAYQEQPPESELPQVYLEQGLALVPLGRRLVGVDTAAPGPDEGLTPVILAELDLGEQFIGGVLSVAGRHVALARDAQHEALLVEAQFDQPRDRGVMPCLEDSWTLVSKRVPRGDAARGALQGMLAVGRSVAVLWERGAALGTPEGPGGWSWQHVALDPAHFDSIAWQHGRGRPVPVSDHSALLPVRRAGGGGLEWAWLDTHGVPQLVPAGWALDGHLPSMADGSLLVFRREPTGWQPLPYAGGTLNEAGWDLVEDAGADTQPCGHVVTADDRSLVLVRRGAQMMLARFTQYGNLMHSLDVTVAAPGAQPCPLDMRGRPLAHLTPMADRLVALWADHAGVHAAAFVPAAP